MAVKIEPAKPSDLDAIVDLLSQGAKQRHAIDQTLWRIADKFQKNVETAVKSAMENEAPPFRERWLLARESDDVVGVAHTVLVPVPPIYAGEFGPPGLIMEDRYVSKDAPAGTRSSLLEAAEADLIDAGAKVILSSSATDGDWESEFSARDYEPLTLYFAKTGLANKAPAQGVRKAAEKDVPSIVSSSATNREILSGFDEFWKPHPDANDRFSDWMAFSLELTDRDMFVTEVDGHFKGYIVSQPVTPLHIPPAHEMSRTGIVDDYYHIDFEDPHSLKDSGAGATLLLRSAEAALAARGCDTALIVCPAAWISKIQLLEAAGYKNAITWLKKR